MADPALKTWVSDQLHSLVGFSEGYLADFVCSLAFKQRTAAGLLGALHEADVPDTAATKRFAAELWSRVPRKSLGASTDKAKAAQSTDKSALTPQKSVLITQKSILSAQTSGLIIQPRF